MPSLIFRVGSWYSKRKYRSQVGMSVAERRAATEVMAASLRGRKDTRVEPVAAGGVPAEWISVPGAAQDCSILYLHGGYYVVGSLSTHRRFMGHLSKATGTRALLIDYRLAPEHPFPAALEDAVAAYRWLLDQGIAARQLVIAGDSAGGGLAVATLLALRDAGLPLPAAAVCLSPWVDLSYTGGSMVTNAATDFITEPAVARISAEQYLAGADPHNPLASPLYADLRGLPPLLIQVGGAEVLLDDATRLADRARAAGLAVKLEIWPDMIHEWQQLAGMVPEGNRAVEQIGDFVRAHLQAKGL